MKICYIPAVSTVATQSVIASMVSITDSIVRVSMNIGWGLIFIIMVTELIKGIRDGNFTNFFEKLKNCTLAGVVMIFIQWFPAISNIVVGVVKGFVG